jgi:hypothetical protein
VYDAVAVLLGSRDADDADREIGGDRTQAVERHQSQDVGVRRAERQPHADPGQISR